MQRNLYKVDYITLKCSDIMGKQLCFTADEPLITAIDNLRIKIACSRSETIERLLKSALANENLIARFKVSGGTAYTITYEEGEQPK